MWPGGRGSPRSSPRLSWNRGAALRGRARWGARSARRPPWAGARARAGGAETSRGKSTPCASCRSSSANSNTRSEIAFVATPRASLRRGARSPLGDWATGPTARPAAWRCAPPPPSWRSRCYAASWPGPCGRRPGCRATARGPIPRAPTAARRTRMKSTSCGTALSGTMPGGHGAPSLATAEAIPHLGTPDQWPSCLRKPGLFPLRLAQGVDRDLLDEFLYRLYGMYLAVLAACMAASQGDQPGHGDSSSRTSRVRGPATPIPGTTSSTPCWGTQSASSHGSGRGPHRTGSGPRTSSTAWSGGPGRWLGCRGRRRSPG